MQIITDSPKETINFGKRLAKKLKKGDVLALVGNLGAGKTTLVKGIGQGLGIESKEVNSPSFVLLKKYNSGIPLYHFDFYRIDKAKDSIGIGFEEFIFGDGISVIEWADRVKEFLPTEYLQIGLEFKDSTKRKISLTGLGKRYKDLIKNI